MGEGRGRGRRKQIQGSITRSNIFLKSFGLGVCVCVAHHGIVGIDITSSVYVFQPLPLVPSLPPFLPKHIWGVRMRNIFGCFMSSTNFYETRIFFCNNWVKVWVLGNKYSKTMFPESSFANSVLIAFLGVQCLWCMFANKTSKLCMT